MWWPDLQEGLMGLPYSVRSLGVLERPGYPVVITVDVDTDSEIDIDLLGVQVAESIWPGLGVALTASGPIAAIGPPEPIHRQCGCIGKHQADCPLPHTE